MHVIVIDEDGLFTGSANTVLERFSFVSKASDAKDSFGNTNFYKNVINQRSNYVWWMTHQPGALNWGNTSTSTFTSIATPFSASLTAGADGTIGNAELITAYDKFADADSVDVSLIVSGPADQTLATSLISNIAERRKDCLVFLSPQKSDVVYNAGNEASDIIQYRDLLTSTSYAVMDSNWKYQFDKYNDTYRWVPMNGDVAGLCVRTDLERDPWFSPGGLNRGIIKNVIKLAWSPSKANRDDLYVKGINPIVSFPGEGTVLFGDKTLLAKPSAFDRINVRRLFIVIEKSIARAARFSLFEFNDQFTRAQFVNLVEPYLRDVAGRRGITDFRVVCDETNNTQEIIDRNEFIGDIYIKPVRSINFIQLNFVAVRSGVSFEEVVGQF
jgi:phage tail sheath protein FI